MHVFYSKNPSGKVPAGNSEGSLVWLDIDKLLTRKNGYKDTETLVSFFSKTGKFDDLTVISKVDSETRY